MTSGPTGQTVAILGGGVGGLVAAQELRRLLPTRHRVILVEQYRRYVFAPSFLWVMTGDRRPDQIVRDLRLLAGSGVEVVEARAVGIDFATGLVETTQGPLRYDYLVIALGAELAPEAVPGLPDAAHTFYTSEGAVRLRDALRAFSEHNGTVAIVVCSLPYKCPGAPHEGAMLIADHFRRRRIRDRVEVHLYTPEPQPMPVAGPALGDAVKEMLQTRDVVFHPLHKLTAVNAQDHELVFDGKARSPYDLLVTIPPHRSPQVVRDAGLCNETGWIPVDRSTLRTRHENVYAVGDVAVIPIPGRWKPDAPMMLPKAGVFAHAQAETVARRIASEIRGSVPSAAFRGHGYCALEAGEGMAGMAYGDFFAEPHPQLKLLPVSRAGHTAKVLFEQWWLASPGSRRRTLQLALTLGARWLGIPAAA